jgi:hypothetical protein
MYIIQNEPAHKAPRDRRPALATLIAAMEKLSRIQRVEITRMGRKARAARVPRIRRLTWRAVSEARQLAREAAQ